jgi:hypothetical protein
MSNATTSLADRFDQLPDPIFIGGYMRSGTSFVMKLLLGHVRITGFKADADLLAPILHAWMPEREPHPYAGIMAVMKQDAASIRRLVRANWFFVYEYAGRPVSAKRIVEKTPDSQAVFARAAEIFPRAQFIVVIREPLSSVRSALAHVLLFHPEQARNTDAAIRTIVGDWLESLDQTRTAFHALGSRILLVNYDEFLADVPGQTRSLFEWCGLEGDAAAVSRAIGIAGGPDDERAFWQRILDWPEDEFARRYGVKLTDSQRAMVAKRAALPYQEVDALRIAAGRSANRPGLSASGTTLTTASPGS